MRIGKVTESVLKRSVLKIIKSDSNKESAAATSDCAYSIDESGRKILSSTAVCNLGIEDEGYYVMHNAANNIFCMGGKPLMAQVTILLPANVDESLLKDIMKSCVRAANDLGITIEGGHTEVSDGIVRPVITITVTGIEDYKITTSKEKSVTDMDVVLTKWIGLEGTAILAREKNEELQSRLPDYMIRQAESFKTQISVRDDARIAIGEGAGYLHDVSMGGIFGALWELAERAGCGLEIDLKSIPIRQETIEITNYTGFNPYLMVSGGALLVFAQDGKKVADALKKEGIDATIIGRTTAKKDRIIRNDDEVRYLDKPQADEIIKIKTCK